MQILLIGRFYTSIEKSLHCYSVTRNVFKLTLQTSPGYVIEECLLVIHYWPLQYVQLRSVPHSGELWQDQGHQKQV